MVLTFINAQSFLFLKIYYCNRNSEKKKTLLLKINLGFVPNCNLLAYDVFGLQLCKRLDQRILSIEGIKTIYITN